MTLSCVRPANTTAGVTTAAAGGAPPSASQPPTPEAPCCHPTPVARGTLVARVQVKQLRGVAPAPGLDVGSGEITAPAQGATVAVLAAEPPQPAIGEQPVDSSGEVVFFLPAGRYVVVVPRNEDSVFPGAIVVSEPLPDGRSVLARQDVMLGAEELQTITLNIVIPLP